MNVKTRIWLEENGHDIFGGGRYRLLVAVRETGSLNRAASELGMSYRQAWGKIKDTEKRLGFTLLARRVGGKGGGGSTLTDRCLKLLTAYEQFEAELSRTATRLKSRYLGFLDHDS